jgi:hypothetical protein
MASRWLPSLVALEIYQPPLGEREIVSRNDDRFIGLVGYFPPSNPSSVEAGEQIFLIALVPLPPRHYSTEAKRFRSA